MSDHRSIWTTEHEKQFLYDMASHGKLHVVDGWLEGASMRSDWGSMDREELTRYANLLIGRV